MPGIDPLWMLNHFHFLDSGRDGRRPLVLSRYAGPGSHRYPVGFSGDTVISWASLDFQPEFTAKASNIGYGWWSHDIGGHFGGVRDDELTTRWVQYGVFSPILRLHSSNNPFLVKEPWAFGAEARALIGEALRLRHRLVPYLHTMNIRAATEDVPLVRPLYHLHPTEQQAYDLPNVYAFGSEMLVAPITTPRDPQTLHGSATAWLPPGTWVDLFTGVALRRRPGARPAPRRDVDPGAACLPAGIVTLSGPDDLDATTNPVEIEVLVVPGADGSFTLLEDDGTGSTTEDVPVASTCLRWDQAGGTLTIEAAHGPDGVVPPVRTWTVTLLASGGPDGDGRTSVRVEDVPTDREHVVHLAAGVEPHTHDVRGRLLRLLDRAQFSYEGKAAIWETLERGGPTGTGARRAAGPRRTTGPAGRDHRAAHRALTRRADGRTSDSAVGRAYVDQMRRTPLGLGLVLGLIALLVARLRCRRRARTTCRSPTVGTPGAPSTRWCRCAPGRTDDVAIDLDTRLYVPGQRHAGSTRSRRS